MSEKKNCHFRFNLVLTRTIGENESIIWCKLNVRRSNGFPFHELNAKQ